MNALVKQAPVCVEEVRDVVLGPEDILRLLPHRDSWSFIRYLRYHPGEKTCTATAIVPLDLVEGSHFPRRPVSPGVLIAEIVAQAAAARAIHAVGSSRNVSLLSFTGRPHGAIIPNVPLRVELQMLLMNRGSCHATGQIFGPAFRGLYLLNGSKEEQFLGEAEIQGKLARYW